MSRSVYPLSFALLLLLGSLLLPAGNAITFNSLIDDGKLAVTLNYPSEVKRGTCFNVRVEVNALTAMSDLNVTLVIELRSGPSVYVLFTGKVVDDWSGGPGPVTNSIVGACVTSSHPTGVIVLRTSIEYNIGSDRLTLVSSFLMGLARDTTYDELAALYSAAQNEISRLRSAVDDLRREAERLRARISELMSEVSALNARLDALRERYERLQSDYASLLSRYQELQQSYAKLQDDYENLTRQHEALRATNSELRKAYDALQKELETLRAEYAELQKQHASLTALHEDLKRRYAQLDSAHQEAVKQIGSLTGALEERGRQMDALMAMLDNALRERNVFSNIVIAQALGLGGLGALYLIERRRFRRSGPSAAPSVKVPEGGSGGPSANGANTPSLQSAQGAQSQTDLQSQENGNGGLIQKVISGRRITIPKKLAELLGVDVGDQVELGVIGDALMVRKYRKPADGQPPAEPDGPSRRS
ncbi:MAG: AbrB/MazE/SpoVT family DNA-binding domain-containing protein [Candidatus Calditenuis sp.]|nr:AbrB/MazE/SpoVT family DNA-binding domain-containing protein [Candidatus Calditenuis sp.]MDT7968647.1 AbrB/MazE/SpoVT family DNA-binding domain-containing protein [Candidatus Calditenuis sp.]